MSFPRKTRHPSSRQSDEQACYSWAVQQSGVDPLNMTPTQAQPVDKSPDGSCCAGCRRVRWGERWSAGSPTRIIMTAALLPRVPLLGPWRGAAQKSKKDAQKEQQAKQAAAATDQGEDRQFQESVLRMSRREGIFCQLGSRLWAGKVPGKMPRVRGICRSSVRGRR